MSGSREIELKLELPRGEAPRLRRTFTRLSGSEGVKQHLVSVYFDTTKHALRKQGLTLRVRSDGKRRVQTVKAGDAMSAGMFNRLEWETKIEGDGPDLKAAARTPVGDILDGKRAYKALAPVFETVVDRTTWRLTQNGSDIEVAIDEGRIIVNGTAWPIAELELELKRGSPSDLFALAHSLDHVKTLKIGVLSKSERGYALAEGHEPTSFKAGPIGLKPSMPAAEAFRTIAHACIRDFRLNETVLIASRSAEPLHQARVAMRRLRSALSLFKPIVADKQYKRLKSRLRHVSRQFGEARNLDVYIAHNAVPNARCKGGLPPVASDPARQVQVERDRAYECVIGTLQSKRFRQFMQDLVAWIETGPWCARDQPKKRTVHNQTVKNFAARALGRSRRELKRDGRHLDRLSPEKRHRIRIEAKKLRYASEFFSGLLADRKHRRRHKAFITALENLQTCLGDLNDIQMGHEIAAELKWPKTALASRSDAVLSETGQRDGNDKRTEELLRLACKAHHRLSYAKPFWRS